MDISRATDPTGSACNSNTSGSSFTTNDDYQDSNYNPQSSLSPSEEAVFAFCSPERHHQDINQATASHSNQNMYPPSQLLQVRRLPMQQNPWSTSQPNTRYDTPPWQTSFQSSNTSYKSHHDGFIGDLMATQPSSSSVIQRNSMNAFDSGKDLNMHRLCNHTDEKPFSKCNVCNMKMEPMSHLDTQYRIHNDEGPFECNVCRAEFAHKLDLSTHAWSHTADRPFKCRKCGTTFRHDSLLKTHYYTHHGQETPGGKHW